MDMPDCAAERKPNPETDWSAVLDGSHALLAIAGLMLAPLDEAYCLTCGCNPCINVHFCRACGEADQRRQNNPQPTKQIWQAAGRCIRRYRGRKALNTFLKWCDQHDVVRTDAMFVFETIVDKELAK
jgi:hypothetical protein